MKLRIELSTDVAEALTHLALRERRTIPNQATWIIERTLDAAGLLSQAPPTPPIPLTFADLLMLATPAVRAHFTTEEPK